jgi:peptidoglycan hydrolase-like amidase
MEHFKTCELRANQRRGKKAWAQAMRSACHAAVLFALVVSLLSAMIVNAATVWKGYGGSVKDKVLNVSMAAGESKTIILTYTNTGEKTWTRGTATGNVELFVASGEKSLLQDASWVDWETPGLIKDVSVKKGKSTTITFRISAATEGTYTEIVRLAAKDVAWMRDAETKIVATVTPKKSGSTSSAASTPAGSDAASTAQPSYAAILLLRTPRQLALPGSTSADVVYGFKNTGNSVWKTRSLQLASVHSATVDTQPSVIKHSSWVSDTQPVVEDDETKPGEIGFLSFTLNAPPKRGEYTVRFALFADGKQVDNAFVDIPMTVTSDGAYQLTPPITSSSSGSGGTIQTSPDAVGTEPIIRVGLFPTTDDRMQIRGVTGGYRVYQKSDESKTICSFTKEQVLTISFDRSYSVYKLSGPGCTGQSSTPYLVRSTVSEWDPLEMADFDRPVSWLPGANDNTFRGILELRYAADDSDHEVWTINELPIEMYLKGLGETSDSSPLEYQKALLTAARTYAYYHWVRGTKHASTGFHVDAKYDQVYRGYGAEARSPNIVNGVESTRGQIVTYQGSLAITPYYSRSDGRTRAWGEVWGGGSNYPWLISVPVPQDVGKTLWGHGVGMSASGALGMANEGSNYQDILKHFYTGIELMKYY